MRMKIEMVEVGPRDGLQNEKVIVSTTDKVELIRRAIAAGSRRIEIASFVNPKKVPQMADAEEVAAQLGKPDGVTRIGLVLNHRGAERAFTCDIDEVGAVVVASDEFGMRNQGQTSAQSLLVASEIFSAARAAGVSFQVTIAVAFGCPFSGDVSHDTVVDMAKSLAAHSPREIALADTIGVAGPLEVAQLVSKVKAAIGDIPVRAHFHNTRNTGIANVWAAVTSGASVIDSSVGGLGGCPFAPGAAGNVATEDVAYMLGRSKVTHGLDISRLIETAHWLETLMGKDMPSILPRTS